MSLMIFQSITMMEDSVSNNFTDIKVFHSKIHLNAAI